MAGISEWEPGATSDKSLCCVSIQNSFPLAGVRVNKGPGHPQACAGFQSQAVLLGTLASLDTFLQSCSGRLPLPLSFFLLRTGLDSKGKPQWGPPLVSGPGLGMRSVSSQHRQGPAVALSPLDYPSSQGPKLAFFFFTFLGLADSNQGL